MSAESTVGGLGESGQKSGVDFDGGFLTSRIGVDLSEERCPACNSLVYSRRHPRCGVCERELPESVLFSQTEAEKVASLVRAEEQRHWVWLSRCGGTRP